MKYEIVALNARGAKSETVDPHAGTRRATASTEGAATSTATATRATPRRDDSDAAGSKTGVFITAESLTFPLATGIGATLLQLLGRFVSGAASSIWYGLLVAAFLGAAIIFLGWPHESDGRAKSRHVVIGMINTLLLAASLMGINGVIEDQPITADSPID